MERTDDLRRTAGPRPSEHPDIRPKKLLTACQSGQSTLGRYRRELQSSPSASPLLSTAIASRCMHRTRRIHPAPVLNPRSRSTACQSLRSRCPSHPIYRHSIHPIQAQPHRDIHTQAQTDTGTITGQKRETLDRTRPQQAGPRVRGVRGETDTGIVKTRASGASINLGSCDYSWVPWPTPQSCHSPEGWAVRRNTNTCIDP